MQAQWFTFKMQIIFFRRVCGWPGHTLMLHTGREVGGRTCIMKAIKQLDDELVRVRLPRTSLSSQGADC
jgi:hypothetical protein